MNLGLFCLARLVASASLTICKNLYLFGTGEYFFNLIFMPFSEWYYSALSLSFSLSGVAALYL
ncbi:hypothetical protein HPCPY1313_1452 [Helicobacter pylori CPY1313]|nr:hypothetical protein HPCPY1313_1452 [Helicobacter pylori CPY1313]